MSIFFRLLRNELVSVVWGLAFWIQGYKNSVAKQRFRIVMDSRHPPTNFLSVCCGWITAEVIEENSNQVSEYQDECGSETADIFIGEKIEADAK